MYTFRDSIYYPSRSLSREVLPGTLVDMPHCIEDLHRNITGIIIMQ